MHEKYTHDPQGAAMIEDIRSEHLFTGEFPVYVRGGYKVHVVKPAAADLTFIVGRTQTRVVSHTERGAVFALESGLSVHANDTAAGYFDRLSKMAKAIGLTVAKTFEGDSHA